MELLLLGCQLFTITPNIFTNVTQIGHNKSLTNVKSYFLTLLCHTPFNTHNNHIYFFPQQPYSIDLNLVDGQ